MQANSSDKSTAVGCVVVDSTTEKMARRCLMHLSIACKLGIKKELLASNPFITLQALQALERLKPADI